MCPRDNEEHGLQDMVQHLVTQPGDKQGDELPKGKMLSLNPKKLVLEQLRTLASCNVAMKTTAAQTCQLIERKLFEIKYELRSVYR